MDTLQSKKHQVGKLFGLSLPGEAAPESSAESPEARELKKQTRMLAETKAGPSFYGGLIGGIFVSLILAWASERTDLWWLWIALPFVIGWVTYKVEYARLTRD